MLANKKYKTYAEFVDDLKICFNDPLVHHLYNKVRYPTGTRCEVNDSIMGNVFDPCVIVEWIEEFNVAGPHYPVKEGRDMTEGVKKEYSAPEIDSVGNVIEFKSNPNEVFGFPSASPPIGQLGVSSRGLGNVQVGNGVGPSHAPGAAPTPTPTPTLSIVNKTITIHNPYNSNSDFEF
jgi:hypothetical protein